MAEPSDQAPAAAGRGDPRASHADRDRVIDTLKAAFVQGRLTKDELDLRAGQPGPSIRRNTRTPSLLRACAQTAARSR